MGQAVASFGGGVPIMALSLGEAPKRNPFPRPQTEIAPLRAISVLFLYQAPSSPPHRVPNPLPPTEPQVWTLGQPRTTPLP